MDRSAHRAQVARILTHTAGGEILLKYLGKGIAFPAAITREAPVANQAQPDAGVLTLEVITIARALFAGKPPRQGEHFTDPAGRRYRIEDDRSVSHAPTYVYACSVSA